MNQWPLENFPNLPNRATWPPSLLEAGDSGKYMVGKHDANHVVLLSLTADDMHRVKPGLSIQARIAINWKTGEVRRPPPGVNLNRWQAEILGKVEEYDQNLQRLRDRALDLSEWDFIGVHYGIPKKNT